MLFKFLYLIFPTAGALIFMDDIRPTNPISHTGTWQKIISSIIYQKAGLVFVLTCIIQMLTLYYQNEYIIPDEFLQRSLMNKYSATKIEDFIAYKNSTAFFRFLSIPLVLGLRISACAICINIGLLLINYKLPFRYTLKIVTNCTPVFILGNLLITIGVLFSSPSDLSDLSLTNDYTLHFLLNATGFDTPAWIKDPLKAINLFEIIFILLLSKCFALVLKVRWQHMLRLILWSYGTGLAIWIIFLVYLKINQI